MSSLTEETGEQCWYCREASAEESSAAPVQLSNSAGKRTVNVPRCRRCASAHQKAISRGCAILFAGLLLGALAAFAAYRAIGGGVTAWASAVALLAIFLVGAIFLNPGAGRLPSGIAPEDTGRDYPAVAQLLRDGYRLPGSSASQVNEDAAEPGACWFCHEAPADESSAASVNLANATGKLAVKVPRCRRCASAHGKAGLRIAAVMVPGLLFGLIAFLPVFRALMDRQSPPLGNWMLGIYALAFIIVVLVPAVFLGLYKLAELWAKSGLPAGVAPDSTARDHPTVARLLQEGYSVAGERPPKQDAGGTGKTEA